MQDSGAIVYGIHAVDSLLSNRPDAVVELLLNDDSQSSKLAALAEKAAALAVAGGLSIQKVAKQALDDLSGGVHQGVVARVKPLQEQGESALDDLLDASKDKPLKLLILDEVTDPHNLGACLRSACAAGVTAIIMPKDRSASLTSVARKVAVGAAELVPVVRVTNLARTMTLLKQYDIWLLGADGSADSTLFEMDLPARLAIVLGSEGKGMRRLTREHCDSLFSIPMPGPMESLNVSVACGIALFEAVRQALPTRR